MKTTKYTYRKWSPAYSLSRKITDLSSLTPLPFTEMHVPSQKSEQLCTCVLGGMEFTSLKLFD
jgi:hypothetical protein